MALTNETRIVTTGLTLRVSDARAPQLIVSDYVGVPTAQHPQHTQLTYDQAKYHTKNKQTTK